MMSLCWILAALLLFLTPDLFPTRSRLPPLTHAVPTVPPVTPHKILFITGIGNDDYDDDYTEREDPTPSPSSNGRHGGVSPAATLDPDARPCSYDPCLEQQVPCAQLSARDGCLCPGLSRANETPHPPLLQELVPAGDGAKGVEVRWCAPASEVSGYQVVVEGEGGVSMRFGQERRRGVVGELEVGARVCVEAVNEAGVSEPSELSCQTYDPPEHPNLALRAGVIGGGLGFLLLLSLTAIILWRRQSCGKAGKSSTEGLGNPSYSTEETL